MSSKLRMFIALRFIAGLLLLSYPVLIYAQQSASSPENISRGISLYQHGDIDGAIKILRAAVKAGATDVNTWYYLGLALNRKGITDESQFSFEKARNLLVQPFFDEYGKAGEVVYDVKVLELKTLLKEGIDRMQELLASNPDSSYVEKARKMVDGLQARLACMEQVTKTESGRTVFDKKDMKETKVRIIERPKIDIGILAGKGTISLWTAFAGDGTITFVFTQKALGRSLTETVIEAVKKIKFEPATVCGRPTYQYLQVEYSINFN